VDDAVPDGVRGLEPVDRGRPPLLVDQRKLEAGRPRVDDEDPAQ
jgi:hypothetical protein